MEKAVETKLNQCIENGNDFSLRKNVPLEEKNNTKN